MATHPPERAGPFERDADPGALTPEPDSSWVALQVEAMAEGWRTGGQPTAAEILQRNPRVGDEAAIRLIYEEVQFRREAGQDVPTSEIVRRYPQWRDPLGVLLRCDRLLRTGPEPVEFPDVGERLGDFELFDELGRGASGRTYLALQPALADRPVVLKVIPRDHDEHLSLARLQHTHIVPLYSEHVFSELGLRALCMPYLGGASLAYVLEGLAAIPADRRQGRDVLAVLDRTGPGPAGPTLSPGPYRSALERASYVQAICWITSCLADALQYAHEHGLVHMDVKPSNVLIAADGQPMLLDFHLAQAPIRTSGPLPDRIGGTPGWTSPEQRAAMSAVAAGRPVAADVDGRSDLYALGLLLLRALEGPSPADERPSVSRLRRRNSQVSVGLGDIIEKSLARDPADRYQDAAALADDLKRHLSEQPLRGVANRSLTERWRKWRRRRPGSLLRGTAPFSTVGAFALLIAFAAAFQTQRVHRIKTDLDDGRRLNASRQYPEAIRCLNRGLALARRTVLTGGLEQDLEAQLRLARRGDRAQTLHELADVIRFRFGVAPPPTDELRALARRCREIWDERELFLPAATGSEKSESDDAVRTDLRELAVVWADLRVRLAANDDSQTARRDALLVLDEAATLFGASPALDRERGALARSLGRPDVPRNPPSVPRTSWEHYDLGRSYFRSGDIAAADAEFRRTLEDRPQDFWSNFYQGLCAFRLGRFADAAVAFRVCSALAPESAECDYNRALADEALGRSDDAFREYSRALELDPRLAPAALNRGILAYNAGRHRDAIADFRRALDLSTSREIVGRIRYNMALAYLESGDRESALVELQKAIGLGNKDARSLQERLLSRRDIGR
jgi:serine/threonine protein kinase/tetratricopeptide (TPR) repeat protein